MGYNKDLKNDDEVKRSLVLLVHGLGKSIAEAARSLGISERSAQKFFNKDTNWAKEWWQKKEEVPTLGAGFSPVVNDVVVGACLNLQQPTLRDFVVKDNGYFDFVNKEVTPKNYGAMPDKVKRETKPKPLKIVIIADTQAKPNVSLDYMKWIGKYIFDKKPDVVVHIGDAYDFESLSSYDKGKKSFEGRRLKADIEAGNESMRLLLSEFKKDGYNPRLVFCTGNHEARFDRLSDNMPELDGFVGTDTLPLADMGWEVYPFLKPAVIENIYFVHYLANPFTGKPYGGNAMNQLKTVGNSFVVGHKQCLDVAIRPTLDGKHQIGIINGAAYDFHEAYKGETGNNHFRGITMLHEVKDGFGLPMFISLDYLKDRYEQSIN